MSRITEEANRLIVGIDVAESNDESRTVMKIHNTYYDVTGLNDETVLDILKIASKNPPKEPTHE